MQLSVPQRGQADRASFPVEPAEVEQWLAGLSLVSEHDAREIHRGLKHSNRLHNDPLRRRAVLERFLPVLRELHARLIELTRAQPLPLVREFSREVALVEALLREEAFAYKILLSEGDSAESDTRPQASDARQTMHALVRRANVIVHGYRVLPDALFEDAHALFDLVETHALLETDAETDGPGISEYYRYLLLLAVADTQQIRARQLPLALDFLREAAAELTIEHAPLAGIPHDRTTYAVDLTRGTRPERVTSLLVDNADALRLFDVKPVLARIDRAIDRTRATRSNTLGVDVLERQTLGRLRTAFAGERERRGARTISNNAQPALFGHKEISSHLLIDRGLATAAESSAVTREVNSNAATPARDRDTDATTSGDTELPSVEALSPLEVARTDTSLDAPVDISVEASDNTPVDAATRAASERVTQPAAAILPLESDGWIVLNRSAQGACLHHPACLPGTVQVGELVLLNATNEEIDSTASGSRAAALLGTVRWLHSDGGAGVTLGLEYLARGVMPVSVIPTRNRARTTPVKSATPLLEHDTPAVAENALIIACKVQQSIVQTILLPPYLFEVGEQLTARQGNRSRRLRLQTCLQANGLFGHFVIE